MEDLQLLGVLHLVLDARDRADVAAEVQREAFGGEQVVPVGCDLDLGEPGRP